MIQVTHNTFNFIKLFFNDNDLKVYVKNNVLPSKLCQKDIRALFIILSLFKLIGKYQINFTITN